MKIPQSARFREEWKRTDLRFTCDHCSRWIPVRDKCAHGYITTEHRLPRYDDPNAEVVFCKEFELD